MPGPRAGAGGRRLRRGARAEGRPPLDVYLKRPGGQSQFSVPLESISTTRRVDELRHHIAGHLADPLTVADLAEALHIGDRQLPCIFKTELGTTPAAYVEAARLEAARNGLETTDDTVSRIATSCGFDTVDTLNRAFRRALGVTPTEYRSRFRVTTPACATEQRGDPA